MTSLARQLQKLAIPGQPSLKQVVSKKRPSLLFDAKEAADIDIETIYALGTNGLEELISIDGNFVEFEGSLFEENCKEFERTVQSREVLKDLDEKISVFLRRVSPYFLLKPAQKCLEWLIWAFGIQSFNVDAVVECVLPYYETILFARVVQLLPISASTSMWNWLRPIQKAGSPLSKLMLTQHCILDPAFLTFVCEMVPRSLKMHKTSSSNALRTLIAFFSSTVVSVLEVGSITEDLVSRLLPYIVKGLKSSNLDYRAATYMIVSQLALKAALEEQLCNSLLESVTKHLGPELTAEGMCCVAVMCQTQQITAFSKKTLKYLLKLSSLVPTLSALSHSHSLTPLLHTLLLSLLADLFSQLQEGRGHTSTTMEGIVNLLDELSLEEGIVVQFIGKLLEHYVALSSHLSEREEEEAMEMKSSLVPLAQSLDAKYPKAMDKALEQAVVAMGTKQPLPNGAHPDDSDGEEEEEEGVESERRMQWLYEFVALSLPGSRHQVLSKSGVTLVVSVFHPDPTLRANAVKQLGKTLKLKSKVLAADYDTEFISSALLGRLADDKPSVVMAVLNLGAKFLFKHLSVTDLLSALIKIVSRKRLTRSSNEWQVCALTAIETLTSRALLDKAPGETDDVIVALLPLLFVGRHGNQFTGQVASALLSSPLAQMHPLLCGVVGVGVTESEVWQQGCDEKSSCSPQSLSAATETMVCHLGRQLSQMDCQRAKALVSKLLGALDSTPQDQPAYFMVLGILGVAMATSDQSLAMQLHITLQLLEHIGKSMVTLEHAGMESSLSSSLSTVLLPLVQKHRKPSLAHALLLLWLLNNIAEHLTIPSQLSTMMWLEVPTRDTEEQLYYHTLLSLFSVLTHCVEGGGGEEEREAGRTMLQKVIQNHFSGRGSLLRFLAMIWTTPLDMEPGQATESHSHSTLAEITVVTQARSLSVACAYLKSRENPQLLALLSNYCPVIPSLLTPLMSSHKVIRDRALECLSLFQQATTEMPAAQEFYSTTPLMHLVNSICNARLEISTDPTCLQQMLGKVFTPESEIAPQVGKFDQTPGKRKSKRKAELEAKAAILETILQCLLVHVVGTGATPYIQYVLLKVLEEVEQEALLTGVVPLMTMLLEKLSHTHQQDETMETNQNTPYPLTAYEGLSLQLAVAHYTPALAPHLPTNTEAFQLFLKLLGAASLTSLATPTPQEMAVKQVTAEFFLGLGSSDLQQTLLQHLIDLLLDSPRSKVITMVKERFKELPLSAELVITELTRHVDQLGGSKPAATPRKRARKSQPPPPPPPPSSGGGTLSRPWRHVTVVLELTQHSCHTITDSHLLPPHLFSLLSRCLEVEEGEREALEYTQQLLLGSLLSLCTHLSSQGVASARELLSESQFNVELVVQCVRLSSNPQTHHHALLLLGNAATIFPSRVLHQIMPIFTFMGANLLRQDDFYSFQVIRKTLDSVIPALIQSGSAILITSLLPRQQGGKTPPTTVEGVVTEIIRVFVDAAPHIPIHRRLPLFSHLLATVGPAEYLHVALALLLEKHVVQTSSPTKDQPPKEGGFSIVLALEFPPELQLLSLLRLLQYITTLPQEKPERASQLRQLPPAVNSLFNVVAHTGKQLRQFKHSSLSFMAHLLSTKAFFGKVSSMDRESSAAVESEIHRLLQCTLGYIGSLSKSRSTCSEDGGKKFWEGMLKKAYDIIEKVVSLLSLGSFLEIMCQLVRGGGGEGRKREGEVQRRSLDILNAKLDDSRTMFTVKHEPQLLKLVEELVGVAREDHSPHITRQTALYGIKLLSRRLATYHHQLFTKVAEAIITLMSGGQLHRQVYASCLLCVAELCGSLTPHTVPLLPSLMPCVLQHIGEVEEGRELLHLSAAVALSTVVQSLPKFLSPYLTDIVSRICHPHLVTSTTKDSAQVVKQAVEIRDKMATSVPPRTLLSTYGKCYAEILQHGKDSVVALLGMLSGTISHLSPEEAKVHTLTLTELFLTALDYRATQTHEPLPVVEEVETSCIQAFTLLVMKLPEVRFQPLFLGLLDWATHAGYPHDRAITFYHLADSVAEKLKNLFLLFAGHLVKSAATLLIENHQEKSEGPFFQDEDCHLASEKSSLLLSYILQCLRKCFLYDSTKRSFLNKERFNALLHPLVTQVSNSVGGEEAYRERVGSCLAPCLAQFAVAARKESLWKKLNSQLLLISRHGNPQVRLAVLRVAQEVYLKLGEEFVTLLPETIPFLAELMEDESAAVEQQTQTLIGAVEGILGESIQQYF